MVALYFTSVEADGKTALCAGIGKKLLGQGRKVGFLKPFQISETGTANGYKDINFIKQAFALEESNEQLSPIHLTRSDLLQKLTNEAEPLVQRIKQAYTQVASNKDIVLMEGLGDLGTDDVSTRACYTIARALEAKVIVILRYSPTMSASGISPISKELGQRLLGVVINLVPPAKMEAVQQDIKPLFQNAGIKVLGTLPQVRSLLGITVGELSEALGGEIVSGQEKADDLVENVMLGAMTPDSGLDYFNRKINKAAIIRGTRADMQLAALETSTKCLVLTSNIKPLPPVASHAEDKDVPVIVVSQDTSGAVAGIEEALAKARFNNLQKLQDFEDVLDSYFELEALTSGLGLKV